MWRMMLTTMKMAMARRRAIHKNGADMEKIINRMMAKMMHKIPKIHKVIKIHKIRSYSNPHNGNRIISGIQITIVIIMPIVRAPMPDMTTNTHGNAPPEILKI